MEAPGSPRFAESAKDSGVTPIDAESLSKTPAVISLRESAAARGER
jgi:hypothetical protein